MSEMMDMLNKSEEKAQRADQNIRVAESLTAAIADGQNQIRSRQDHIAHVQTEIREGRLTDPQMIDSALGEIGARCPNLGSLQSWRTDAVEALTFARENLLESRELAMKARDLESTRITHGG